MNFQMKPTMSDTVDIESVISETNYFYTFKCIDSQNNSVIVKGKIENCKYSKEELKGQKIYITYREESDNNGFYLYFLNCKFIRTKVGNEKSIVCTIHNVIYEDKETMFYILNTDEGIIKGNIPFSFNSIKDTKVRLNGEWVKNNKGVTFDFEEIKILESDVYFFLTKVVKGIGAKMATNLLSMYEENVLCDILENNPEALLNIKGLKSKKLRKIKSHWDEYKHLSELSFLLKDYGVKTVTKIFTHFKGNSLNRIKENPYCLCEIKSIGFKIADKIKDTLEIKVDSQFRIQAGLIYCIEKNMDDNGDTYIQKEHLFNIASEELNIEDVFTLEEKLFNEALKELEQNPNLKKSKSIIYLDKEKELISIKEYYEMEMAILEFLKERKNKNNGIIVKDIHKYIENLEKTMNMKFSEEQKDGLIVANNGSTLITLRGYAGTGKSTISKAMITLLKEKYKGDIICTAFSGMASNRIKKTTGIDSKTIHSLIGFKKDGYTYNRENKLPYEIILIDESSMINTKIFYRLIDAIADETIVLFVGDPAQLPPIGAGNIFSDIIKNNLSNGGNLTKIYRQSEDAVITYFASFIRKGEVPPNLEGEYSDFSFKTNDLSWGIKNLPEKEAKEAKEKNSLIILNDIKNVIKKEAPTIISKYNPNDIKEYISYLQIISPMKKGILGTDYLNKVCQKILNFREPEAEYKRVFLYSGNEIRVRDKILHRKNANMKKQGLIQYKKEPFTKDVEEEKIYNGQLGIVIAIDEELEEVHCFFPNESYVVNYSFKEAKEYLDLSYALTIHKTQGSEFSNVIMPIVNSHFMMLNNQLLYTAITRAKDNIKIFGHSFAFKKATTTVSGSKRQTVLDFFAK